MNKIHSLSYASTLLFLFFLAGCDWFKSSEQQNLISKQQSLYVIDTLDKTMHENCHIPGSIQISVEEVESFVKNLKKDTELVTYCSNYMCGSSGIVAKKLKKLGFGKVWAYEGGIAEWYQKGFPVKGICSDKYLQKKMEKNEHKASEFEVITAQELYEKMKAHRLL